MTKAWPYLPGVPAAGHVTSGGFWHPGKPEGCPKCEPSEPRRRQRMSKTAPWLQERVNDPYGTPNKVYNAETGKYEDNPFWVENPAEVVGSWKVFQKDGLWYAYKTTQNAWSVGFATKAEAMEMAQGTQFDVWS